MSNSRNFDLNLGYDADEGNEEDYVIDLDGDGLPSSNEIGQHSREHDQIDGVDGLFEDVEQVENEHSQPHVGMTFADAEDVLNYCEEYGKAKGFQVRIRTSVKIKGDEDKYKSFRLVCSKAGKFETKTKNPGKGPTSCVTGCQFHVNASLHSDGLWKMTKVTLEHNHDCVPKNSKFLPNYRFISEGNRKRILENDRAGVPIIKNYTSFVVQHGSHDKVPFEERDCRNLIGKARRKHMEEGDFNAMRKYFDEMSSSNSNFFYTYDVDEDERLRNVFWADGRSRAAYMEFGDVISFDTTYLSNRYKMSFAPFIGVNNHGQSVLFGCALIAGDDTENFVWLFRAWLKCMSGKAPQAIITDQCRSIGNAVAQVFPNTPHRWCIWHIMQNARKKFIYHPQLNNILKTMQDALHDSLSISEFEDAWKEMIATYGLEKHSWCCDMYEKRHRWVPVYFKEAFWAGMSSTQRSEGMNFFFKKYVNVNTTLKTFVEQYGLALSNRVMEEERATFTSKNSPIRCMTDHVFELVFQKLYTSAKFSEVQKEVGDMTYNNATKVDDDGKKCLYDIVVKKSLHGRTMKKVFRVTMDKVTMEIKCECKNFEFRGILCSHILRVFHEEEVDYVPERYIMNRWRKDLDREHLKVSVPYYELLNKKPESVQRYENMHGLFESFAGVAMNEEEFYKEVMSTFDGLKIKANRAAKEKHGRVFQTLNNIGKVYGRRSIRRDEQNCNVDGVQTKDSATNVKDPIDKRGRGKAAGKRKGYRKKPVRNTKPCESEVQKTHSNPEVHHVNFIPHPNIIYNPNQTSLPYAVGQNMTFNPPFQMNQLSQPTWFQQFRRD